ncbi:MAG: two-component sensor histidine kinase [Actinobacteria bacterium]|nr:two-component sensor histidine kinase [Actinomycetota bacterium]
MTSKLLRVEHSEGPNSEIQEIPDEVARILAVLPSCSIVADQDGNILRASPKASALGLVNRNVMTVREIAKLVHAVAGDGDSREEEMRVRRPPLGREMLELRVRVADLGTGAILVLIDDLAEERRVDAVRRDFVANISHELKTPVGALSVLAEAVQSASEDPEQVRHFAERMQMEATRLGHLVQDIIDLSRLQGDDPLTHSNVVDIDEVVQRAVEDVRMIAVDRGISVVVASEAPTFVFADASQLQTAVRNLLVNAIAYSSDGTSVAIHTREINSIVEIMVKDQGIGIPSNDLDRVFERFYRVDPARSRVTGGTGLGLAIVKHVCQNHGGECAVWSEVGVGSTFTLRLPTYTGADAENATNESDIVEVPAMNGDLRS